MAAHASIQGHWWPQAVQTAAAVSEADIAQAETRVLDHLQGWRSIVPTYKAILAFDLAAALRQVIAPTLVLELLTDREAHLPRQATQICALMPDAVPGHIAGADGLTPETRPSVVVDAILPFLLAGKGS